MTIPYIDNATFIEAPTGIDTSQIVPQGMAAQQSAALTNLLERATSWANDLCFQDLRATLEDPEEREVKPDRFGRIRVFTKNFPIVSLSSVQWMDTAINAFTAVDLTHTRIADRSFLVFDKNYGMWRGLGMAPLIMQYIYVAGYPHTRLTSNAGSNATSVVVESSLGIGTTYNLESHLEILDGAARENITVTSVAGNTLTLASGLANAHSAGALVTAMPQAVQQAVITLAAFLIRSRGVGALVMGPRGTGRATQSGYGAQGAQRIAQQTGVGEAMLMLKPFTRTL